MTIRYKLFISICVLATLCYLSSCKKLIEIEPPSGSVGNEVAFGSNALAEGTMAGVYSQLMNNSGSLTWSNGATSIYAGLAGGELVNYTGTQNTEDYQFYTSKLTYATVTPYGAFWTPGYKVIYTANAIMENLAKSTSPLLDDTTRVKLTGECKFVRAFCYFYLTNLFGDVPLALTSDFNQTANLARTAQDKVYDQIVQDLKDAQQVLPGDFSAGKGQRVRANKLAATALLARVYLYRKDWPDAEAQADSVISNGQYSLVPDLNGVFTMNSQEAILQFQQSSMAKPYNGTWEGADFTPNFRWSQIGSLQSYFLSEYSTYQHYLVPGYFLTDQAVQVFEPGDKRKAIWVDSSLSPVNTPYNGKIYYFPEKYTLQIGSPTGAFSQYYMVLRLAEQYLIRAEARAEQNNFSGAADDIDKIRARAGLPATTASAQSDLLAAIALERQREFFAEWGHRWLDLKRTGQATTVLGAFSYKQPWDPNQLLFPIPQTEMINDANLIQNPGYN